MNHSATYVRPALAALVLLAGLAMSQNTPKHQPAGKPTAPAAAVPAVQPTIAAPREAPEVGPYITLSAAKDYNLNIRVRLASDNPTMKERMRDPNTGATVDMPVITPFDFSTMGMVWPMIPSSASATQLSGFGGTLRINGEAVGTEFKVLEGYPAGVKLARWDALAENGGSITCRQVQLDVLVPVTISKTDFDEPAALKVPWPKGAWPVDVASSLAPQLYVELGLDPNNQVQTYEDAALTEALKKWLDAAGVSDPKRVSPVALAKIITRGVWGAVQINDKTISSKGGFGEISTRTGEFGGVVIQPPSMTLQSGRATAVDATALLAAMFKKAGLPARTVIAWDVGKNGGSRLDRDVTGRRGASERGLRYWVEFPVYDEAKNTLNWVPVDIMKLAKTSSRPMPLERTWRFFGSHDELNTIVPFAFQFHPPTDVVAYGAAAFWGWFVTPKAPDNAEQVINFDAAAASRRGGEDPPKPRHQDDKKKDK